MDIKTMQNDASRNVIRYDLNIHVKTNDLEEALEDFTEEPQLIISDNASEDATNTEGLRKEITSPCALNSYADSRNNGHNQPPVKKLKDVRPRNDSSVNNTAKRKRCAENTCESRSQEMASLLQLNLSDVPLTHNELFKLYIKYKLDGHFRVEPNLPSLRLSNDTSNTIQCNSDVTDLLSEYFTPCLETNNNGDRCAEVGIIPDFQNTASNHQQNLNNPLRGWTHRAQNINPNSVDVSNAMSLELPRYQNCSYSHDSTYTDNSWINLDIEHYNTSNWDLSSTPNGLADNSRNDFSEAAPLWSTVQTANSTVDKYTELQASVTSEYQIGTRGNCNPWIRNLATSPTALTSSTVMANQATPFSDIANNDDLTINFEDVDTLSSILNL